MPEIWVAFITGLTTGGLSCMAVQGGLLASSLANQLELDISKSHSVKPSIAFPIILFLLAKLLAYTLLGFLLGALGSMLQLTALMRALLQFAIGIFMVGNALRMLNVHPIFRYFSFEPPSLLTRFIRKEAKDGSSALTPLLLGTMTVFIPCGVTQVMMAVALGSANSLFGAAILFAFVLGTSPVFFTLAYLATRLGATLEKYFMRIVAVIILLLGIFAFDTGLNLIGSPYSLTRMIQAFSPSASQKHENSPVSPQPSSSSTEITLNVTNRGYEPEFLHAPADTSLKLNLVTDDTYSCARAFVIPELNVEVTLPAIGTTQLDIPAQPAGKVIPFSCSMGMYTGQIVFDL